MPARRHKRKVKTKSRSEDDLRTVIRDLRSKIKAMDAEIAELKKHRDRAENEAIVRIDEIRMLVIERNSYKSQLDGIDIERVKALQRVAVLEKQMDDLRKSIAVATETKTGLMDEKIRLLGKLQEGDKTQ